MGQVPTMGQKLKGVSPTWAIVKLAHRTRLAQGAHEVIHMFFFLFLFLILIIY